MVEDHNFPYASGEIGLLPLKMKILVTKNNFSVNNLPTNQLRGPVEIIGIHFIASSLNELNIQDIQWPIDNDGHRQMDPLYFILAIFLKTISLN